jgi:hypothetical protein
VVDDSSGQGEDGPCDRQGDQELSAVDVAVLGFRRILVIDQPPDDGEQLLAIRPASSPPPMLTGRNASFPCSTFLAAPKQPADPEAGRDCCADGERQRLGLDR